MNRTTFIMAACLVSVISYGETAQPQQTQADQAAELAKKLANPIANLISVPLQYNYNQNIGPKEDGSVNYINVQPVIPVSINDEWNLITRTILPLVDQSDIPVKGQGESGIGDTTASQFFSPKAPTKDGWIWGAGPVELIPTASDSALGGEKVGVGPTFVALKQEGPWTVGFLGNHIWSVAGDDDREDISSTFLQPFMAYIVEKTKTTISLNTESTYDWRDEEWSVPANLLVAQMFKVGSQIMQFGVGARYYLEETDNGASGWGARAQLTFLFPK